MARARVGFVAVVYNNYKDTADFCSSLSRVRSVGCAIECFIIDNSDVAMVSEEISLLSRDFEFVRVLRPGANLGYFGAFNYFFETVGAGDFDFVVLCNNDLLIGEDFCDKLRDARYAPDVMVVCPDVVTLDGVHQNPHVLKPLGPLSRLKLDLYFSSYRVARALMRIKWAIEKVRPFSRRMECASSCYLHLGIGACYVLLPKFLNKFGKLDYPHFLYGEEAYLSRQVHSLGGRLYYDANLKVRHKESATLSKLPGRVTYEFGRDGYWDYRRFY
jgi:GT2 family glycosyltransferase